VGSLVITLLQISFAVEYTSQSIFEIGQYLAKLWTAAYNRLCVKHISILHCQSNRLTEFNKICKVNENRTL